ncbi:MAG: hypothetical protein JXB34_02850 [Bacteroidales bacterium]|nr:hypothetical protein [Bacteroidales bacterium]
MDNTYSIGGSEVRLDVNEAIQQIPQNKTLIIQKLTDNTPVKPEIIEGLKTVEEVFEHFRPKVEVEFENSDGGTIKEEIQFRNLGDFGLKGITNKSSFLKELTQESQQYRKMVKQLKTNKILKAALTDPEAKTALISAIKGLIAELNQEEQ